MHPGLSHPHPATKRPVPSSIAAIRALRARGHDEDAVRLARIVLKDRGAEATCLGDVHFLMALSLFSLGRNGEAASHYALALAASGWQ